jgi:O-acetylserine/cysteine efflux transporter
MSPKHLVFAVFINIVMGFSIIAAKTALEHFPPLLFTGLRYAVVLICIFPLLRIQKGRMRDVIITALLIGPVGFGVMFTGLQMSTASIAAVANQLMLPFAAILSIFMLGEVIHWQRWLGIALSFVGVVIMGFDPEVLHYGWGLAIIVFGALLGAFSTIYMRKIREVPTFEVQAWVALTGVIGMAFASLALESDQLALMQTAAWIDWSAVLYVSLGSSLIGHAGSFYLLKHYEVSVVAPLMLLAPISTVVFGILLLGDVMTPRMIVGTLVALTGVLIVMLRQAKKIPPVPLD